MSDTESPKPIPKSLTKEYYRKYYHDSVKQTFTCEFCKCQIVGAKSQYTRHIKTNKCKHMQAQLKCMEFFKQEIPQL